MHRFTYHYVILGSGLGPPGICPALSNGCYAMAHCLPPLNWVTGHPCHGLPSCQFSASYALPFSTYGQARDRRTERQTTAINA